MGYKKITKLEKDKYLIKWFHSNNILWQKYISINGYEYVGVYQVWNEDSNRHDLEQFKAEVSHGTHIIFKYK